MFPPPLEKNHKNLINPGKGSKLTDIPEYNAVTPETITEAAAAGITGVKVYPQGMSIYPSIHLYLSKYSQTTN